MGEFKASTHYGDWKGTAAADDQRSGLRDWLSEKGLVQPTEFLIAASLHIVEFQQAAYIHAYTLQNTENFEAARESLSTTEGPIPVRQRKVDLTTEEFLDLFKQFSVVLTWHDLSLKGREFEVTGT